MTADPRAEGAPGLRYTICFLRCGPRLLLLNRAAPPAMGLWTGLGGKLEPGESPLRGALREVAEEAGLMLPAARLAGTITWGSGGMYAFVAEVPAAAAAGAGLPRETREGLLAWREEPWALDARNCGLAPHVRLALPALLEGGPPREHRFRFAPGGGPTDWTILDYTVLTAQP